jgi:Zn-dependent peptidase ImmA (M78 family)/transcriptional regulator with XRE-family HTH domain
MNEKFNPEMLTLACDFRGMTQTELARQSGVPQGNISKYGSGVLEIRPEHLRLFAETLDFPEEFFYRDGEVKAVESASVFHRKRKTIPVKAVSKIDAAVNLLRLDIERLFNAADAEPGLVMPQYRPAEFKNDIEFIAGLVRAAWSIPAGPIRNLVAYVEAAGCVVLLTSFETDKMDAVSQWKSPSPPVIIMNDQLPGERQRFSLAHELGHLVMHKDEIPYEAMEAEADKFASALLMPADRIKRELDPVTIEHLVQIKPSWRVSVQALIRRSRDLHVITDRKYTSLFQMLSKAGYRTEEPFPLPLEEPTLLRKILDFLYTELQYSPGDVAKVLCIHERTLRERYMQTQVGIRLVPRPKRSRTIKIDVSSG